MPVDPSEVQRSVADLMSGVGPTGGGPPRPLADGLKAVLRAAELILAVDCIGVLLLDEDGRLRPVASTGPVAAAMEEAQARLGVGPGVDTVLESATVVVNDLHVEDRYAPLMAHLPLPDVRAVVSAPIWVHTEVAGNLNAMRLRPQQWTLEEISAVEAYAGVVATLLEIDATTVQRPPPPHTPH